MNQDEYLDWSSRNPGGLVGEAAQIQETVNAENAKVDLIASAGSTPEFLESQQILADRAAKQAQAEKIIQAMEG